MKTLTLLSASIAALSLSAVASAQAHDYFYFSDYISSKLDRVNVDPTGAIVTNGGIPDVKQVVNGGIKEGIDGSANTVIVVESGGQTIARYDRATGARIGLVTNTHFGGIGMIALTQDAKTMYVTDEQNSSVSKIDMATGATLATVGGIAGAHDVAVAHDGSVYVTGYNGNTGVVKFDAALGNQTQFVSPSYDSNGLSRPVGISLDGAGNLWVENNQPRQNLNHGDAFNPIAENIYAFRPDGSELHKYSSDLLQFSFGSDFGPDGNLYIATLGDFKTQASGPFAPGGNPNYHNGIYKLDVATGLVSPYLVTGDYDAALGDNVPALPGVDGAPGVLNLVGPKYVKFESSFVPGVDPGGNPVPEPATLCALGAGLIGLARKRKRA